MGNRGAPDPAGRAKAALARTAGITSTRFTGAPAVLGVLLLAGLGLRLLLTLAYRPAFLGYPDAIGYIAAARLKGPSGLLFYNPYRPAGYPLFLTWLHSISSEMGFVVIVQHLMGLVMAVLLYLTLARSVEHRWVALLPAAVVLLSGTEIFLEHSVLSETLYTFLVVAALWAASRSIDANRYWDLVWLAAAGALIGFSGPVRSAGVFVAPALVGWAIASHPGWRRRLARGGVTALAFAVALGGYLDYQHGLTHTWSITRTGGETLYARVATFANCHDFTPPAGTRQLCQSSTTPRVNANGYMFGAESPVTSFGEPPDPRDGGSFTWASDAKMESFGIDAIVHQPGDFAWTTLGGLVGYVDPGLAPKKMIEYTQDELIANLELPPASDGPAEVQAYYPGTVDTEHHTPFGWLNTYARDAKVEGPVTAVLLILMLAGFILARGRRRSIAGLLGWTTVFMMVSPVALLFYGVRYATPAYGPLAASAAVGLDLLIPQVRGVRRIAYGRFGRVPAA